MARVGILAKRGALLLVALCHAAASLAPCGPPPVAAQPGAGHLERAAADAGALRPEAPCPHHAERSPEEPRPLAALAPRCPCGCGDAAAPGLGHARLGAALLLAAPAALPRVPAAEAPAWAGQLPAAPVFSIEHVPLSLRA
jgi:hypothetical protein